MKADQVKAAKMSQLVDFYNLHADRKVKKFQDRATAERRVLEVIEMLPSDADFAACGDLAKIIPPSPEAVRKEKPIRRRNSDFAEAAEGFRQMMVEAGADVEEKPRKEAKQKEPKLANSRSIAMRKSWENPTVAALRANRMTVLVEHNNKLVGEFKSVPDAFRKLGLPWAKMVEFRGYLRQNGEATISVYRFEKTS